MNKEEFIKAEKALKEDFEEKRKQLAREFAISNNPVKIGDVISDHCRTIRVLKLLWCYNLGYPFPCMVYRGVRLTKKGEPSKREADDNRVVQKNNREINGKPYKYEVE